jgi:hypothetical protein
VDVARGTLELVSDVAVHRSGQALSISGYAMQNSNFMIEQSIGVVTGRVVEAGSVVATHRSGHDLSTSGYVVQNITGIIEQSRGVVTG